MSIQDELLKCRGWIQSALEKGGDTHDFVDIVDKVMSGHMQLWSGANGCAVTEILVYPNKKILHVFLAGGDQGHGIQQITDNELRMYNEYLICHIVVRMLQLSHQLLMHLLIPI